MSILHSTYNQKGSTLVEVLVAIALAGIMLPALLTALVTANAERPTAKQQLAATAIMQSAAEETRQARDTDWTSIATNGTYHPVENGTSWTLTSGSQTIGDFTLSEVITDIGRVPSGAIVARGGVTDPASKQVVITVSWSSPHPANVTTDMYVTRWANQSSWTQTSPADFNDDTLTNITVTNDSGGEAVLTPGQSSGTLTSQTFNALSDVGFIYFNFDTNLPPGTSIKIQLATNDDNSTWNYVGPDGTNSTYYKQSAAVALPIVNGRYFRYQVTFSTTNASDPSLNDVTLTYSK